MCGRYELHTHPAAIALAFGLAEAPAVAPRYNIAPMTQVPVIRARDDTTREWVEMRWGLVPRWAKDPAIGAKLINARAETVAEKPSFSTAFRRHRCLIPADGFYEWRPTPSGKRPVLRLGAPGADAASAIAGAAGPEPAPGMTAMQPPWCCTPSSVARSGRVTAPLALELLCCEP